MSRTEVAAEVFSPVDPGLRAEIMQKRCATVVGGRRSSKCAAGPRILTAERSRSILCSIQRDRDLDPTIRRSRRQAWAKILDTRKTTPGLRGLRKAAVVAVWGRRTIASDSSTWC